MAKAILIGFALLAGGFVSGEAMAQDVAAGKDKARACSACHGQLGIATAPDAPNLAGENKRYIERQLEAYRAGERRHQQMSIIAEGLSDADIKDLAAWFAAIRVTVEAPELDG